MKYLCLAFLMIMIALASAGCPNPTGFRASFTATSYNLGGGGSYFESGQANIDFVGQRLSSVFDFFSEGNNMMGMTWQFGANKTAYYMLSDGTCHESSSNSKIPSGYPEITKDIGPLTIGVFPVEMFTVESDSPALNQTALFDINNCVLVSSYLSNADESNPGFCSINFYNVGVPSDSDFQLPQACIDVVGSSRPKIRFNHHKKNTFTQMSKTMNHILNALKF
ncbi:hypothetical protein CYY_004506 [Polysphondylium violaceum]|uniref:Uncharacterized protein n=1 Tax=Polysphondylium violaceum TaxID=133409 RepID=A0A8J4V0B3_9MYCE|nr:hypothetical protein CYY_004506 [Polysphondylium violaceum]